LTNGLSTYQLHALISAPKIPTDFLWGLSLFFVVIAVVYFVFVFFFRNKLSRKAKQIIAKRKVFSPMICEFLFFDENGEKKEKVNYIDLKIQIRELLKNQFEREVLTSVLLDLRKDVSGKTQTELFHMYQDLELHKDAYKNLKSWRWELVSKGIFELTQMEVKDSYSLITKFINDKRSTIRKQAEIATVSLEDEGINYFLDHTKFKISEWQQLKLLDVVRNKKDYIPPPFRLWLTSKNNHVVLFSLRLIKYYNQNDASASLIQLLRHKNNQIKKEAIFCIRDFNVTDAVPTLKQIFWKCNTDVKMYVLEALSHLGTEEDIGFIEHIVNTEMAFTVKGKAITALNTIRPEGVLPTNDILPKEEFENTISESFNEINDLHNHVEPKNEEKTNLTSDILVASEVITNDTIEAIKIETEITAEEIAFLPLITDAKPDILEPITNKEDVEISLNQIDVQFEEVLLLPEVEELHFEFLPIVIEEKNENTLANNYQELKVYFDEVIVSAQEVNERNTSNKLIYEILVNYEELVFSDLDDNEIIPSDVVKPEILIIDELVTEEGPLFLDGIPNESVFELSVNFDVVVPEIIKNFKVESFTTAVDWSNAFESNIIELDNDTYAIPKPVFYESSVLKSIMLLENIAEMGDQREIPFLQELLNKETNAIVVDRINTLIAGFSKVDESQNLLDFSVHEVRHSVFYNLLENKDEDVKLILLKEIAAIGDEKEIPLLKEITLNGNRRIREAANWALEQIYSRTSIVRETTISEINNVVEKQSEGIEETKNENEIFNITFEVEPSISNGVTKTGKTKDDAYGNTMFDHLCAMSTKLYDKE
jgi:HEAT repeat protein